MTKDEFLALAESRDDDLQRLNTSWRATLGNCLNRREKKVLPKPFRVNCPSG